ILGLSEMNAEQIADKVDAELKYGGRVDLFEDFPGAREDPDLWRCIVRDNQWRWEITQLAIEAPEKGQELAAKLKEISAEELAAFLIPGILAHDTESGINLTLDLLSREEWNIITGVRQAVGEGIESGQISPE